MTGGAVIYVKDLDAAIAFDARVAGLPMVQREAGCALLGAAPAQLTIHQIPAPIVESIVIARPAQRREDAPVKPVFLVPSIDGARAAAKALGGTVDGSEQRWRFHDHHICDGHDPEGNVFQIREPAT